jgi:hypothetical protein
MDRYQLLEGTAPSISMAEESSMAAFVNQWEAIFHDQLGGLWIFENNN